MFPRQFLGAYGAQKAELGLLRLLPQGHLDVGRGLLVDS